MPVNITFRTQLLGGVTEFCTACRIPLFSNALNLVELVVLLAKYKEEGNPLHPEVYATTDISGLITMLPEAEKLQLGTTTRDANGIKHAIKKCAPLATGGWLIYLHDSSEILTYGLFRGTSNPVSVLVDRVLLDKHNSIPVSKVFQVAEDCVELIAWSGEHHFVFLNHRREDSPPPLESLSRLIEVISSKTAADLLDPTQSFLTRILYNALRVSHGTLIAVTDRKTPPKNLFDDGLRLDEPVDFPNLIKLVRRGDLPPGRLTSVSSLLEGMLNSDGIILFDNKARLLGFNYFVRAKAASKESGGARRRAFATLVKHIDKGLCAAFIQSQDGWSDFRSSAA